MGDLMSRYARVADGAVVEIIDTDLLIEDLFHADIAATFHPATGSVEIGYRYANGVFTAPVVSIDDLRAAKLAAISTRATELLDAGAPVDGGLHIALDDASRADLTAMAATATIAAAGTVPWPASYSRGWIALENQRIPLPEPTDGLMLAAAVGGYYAAIVQHRRDLKDAALAAETAADIAAIDLAAGWPTNS